MPGHCTSSPCTSATTRLEVGSGLGDYADRWLEGGQRKLTVSDADASRRAILAQRFAGDPRVQVRTFDLFAPYDGGHSALVALNVLEHIEDDIGALTRRHRLLRPGGKVVMFVPAFAFAMSRFDRAVGHYRRYSRATLTRAFQAANLRIERINYVNAPGLRLASVRRDEVASMTPQDGWSVRVMGPDSLSFRWPVRSSLRVQPPFGQLLERPLDPSRRDPRINRADGLDALSQRGRNIESLY